MAHIPVDFPEFNGFIAGQLRAMEELGVEIVWSLAEELETGGKHGWDMAVCFEAVYHGRHYPGFVACDFKPAQKKCRVCVSLDRRWRPMNRLWMADRLNDVDTVREPRFADAAMGLLGEAI